MDALNIRINELIEKLQLSKSAFATALDVSQAIITHITTGRNKPGVEILQKIVLRYPNLSAEWLLTGNGPMFKKDPVDKFKVLQTLQLLETRLQNAAIDIKAAQDIIELNKPELEK